MTSPTEPAQPAEEQPKRKMAKVRTHTPRPDELSRECFEFIAAVDHYKRSHMRSFLEDREVLEIFFDLGWSRPDVEPAVTDDQLEDYAASRLRYRVEQGRLFPTWSEVFDLFMALGYKREEEDTAA